MGGFAMWALVAFSVLAVAVTIGTTTACGGAPVIIATPVPGADTLPTAAPAEVALATMAALPEKGGVNAMAGAEV